MTGEREDVSLCPLCGGDVRPGLATIPFVLAETVVVVKGVPADSCDRCHEAFTAGEVTDRLLDILKRLRGSGAEVSIVSYSETRPAPSPTPVR